MCDVVEVHDPQQENGHGEGKTKTKTAVQEYSSHLTFRRCRT